MQDQHDIAHAGLPLLDSNPIKMDSVQFRLSGQIGQPAVDFGHMP